MQKRTRHLTAAALVAALALAVVPAARADLFATLDEDSPQGDSNLVTYDIATRIGTNPGVNTSGEDFYPSIAGNRLVFAHKQGLEANHIILRDTTTGQQADLFNGFEAAAEKPLDPVLTPDGRAVITGHINRTSEGSRLTLTSTDVSAFPTGPFPHTAVILPGTGTFTAEPLVVGTNPLDALYDTSCPDVHCGGVISRTGTVQSLLRPSSPEPRSTEAFSHSAMAPGGAVVVGEFHRGVATFLDFTSSAPSLHLEGPLTTVPFPVGSGTVQERPAFSPNGRYLAFVSNSERLLVWDSQTQLLLDPTGIAIKGSPHRDHHDNLVLIEHPVLKSTFVLPSGTINFQLLAASGVGIIVQKVIGRTRVLGRPAPKLRFLGRVPLGQFPPGHGHVHWDRRVNGHALMPGLYQVTVRSVTAAGGVRDLGHPTLLRIRAGRR